MWIIRNLQKSKVTSTLSTIVILVISVLISLCLGEWYLRTFEKDRIVLFPRYHSAAQYSEFTIRRFRPDTIFWHTSMDGSWRFQINSNGFRNFQNYEYEKSTDVLRILSLGDSHTAGFEVRQEKTFSEQIQSRLIETGVQAEVINSGVSGFSTAEQLVFLENEGLKYGPDFVILAFYANDFEDNIKAGLFDLDQNNNLVSRKKVHLPGVKLLEVINQSSILRWLSENSYLYSYSLNTVWELAKKLLLDSEQSRIETEYAVPQNKIDNYQKRLAKKLIERIYDVCEQYGINLIIVDIPVPSLSTEILPSIPDEEIEFFKMNSHSFLSSKDLFRGYHGDYHDLHVPNGHRHISESSHGTIAEFSINYILNSMK